MQLNKYFRLFILIIFSVIYCRIYGQSANYTHQPSLEKGFVPIRNYSPQEYAARPQNWSIIEDDRGMIYVGNNEGVLEYDGVKWRVITTTKETNIRSMSKDSIGRIYIGAQGEFGYLAPDSVGKLQYLSLLDQVDEKYHDFVDVWKTYATEDGVYFQTTGTIFRWDGDTIRTWLAESQETAFHILFFVNGTIYVRQNGIGLKKMVDDQLVLIQGGELFAKEKIYFMMP